MVSTGDVSARAIAAHVLTRAWCSDAFAAASLDAALRRASGLDPRDARLATELVYGVLRTQPFLEERVAALAPNRRWGADPEVRAHLLMGTYTLLFLDRIPPFAAVSEAVAGVRAASGPRLAAFANAVLRRMADEVRPPGGGADRKLPSLGEAVVASAPGWLRGSLRRSLGRAGAEAFLSAGLLSEPDPAGAAPGAAQSAPPVAPPGGLCLAPGEDRDAWIETLRKAVPGAWFEPGRNSPRAILVRGAGDLRRLPGFGVTWIGQEEGAQVVALALGAHPGERVLDACAGRGNKTWLLAREVGARSAIAASSSSAVDAADLYPTKLEHAAALGAHATYAVDWSVGVGDVPEGYDRVLVDAPCSGVGTLRRRPEIALRREPHDVSRLSALEVAIARRAATRARDGGRLVFAVCSVLREEAEDVVERLVAPDPNIPGPHVALEPAPFDAGIAQELSGGGSSFRLLPHVHGTDGYFAASFIVRR